MSIGRAVALALAVLAAGMASAAWPTVGPLTKSFDVDLDKDLISIDLPFVSKNGDSHFLFWCRGGSTATLDEMSDREGFNCVGPLMCVLNEGDSRSEGSLLAEEDVGPWRTRGMFYKEELVGACANYPEFGRDRSFRMHGMVLRLRVSDVRRGNDGLPCRFKLTVEVTSEPRATSAYAERPGYLHPDPADCSVVRKGKEPRQCRDWSRGGSYGPCRDDE